MEIGVFEARNRFSELIDAAERGEETMVLRRGKPVARIVPVVAPNADVAARRMQALRDAQEIGARIRARLGRVFTHEELMEARDEGKR
ncbi:MAG: type II toxin-antitoxin system prevent-host-death family antitoxin [Caulobacter sp.]|nr:type II toxin-antitoxin system prevent-host-death family antitoxin [Caulobacter sp.]